MKPCSRGGGRCACPCAAAVCLSDAEAPTHDTRGKRLIATCTSLIGALLANALCSAGGEGSDLSRLHQSLAAGMFVQTNIALFGR
jgi:hypothetical protein